MAGKTFADILDFGDRYQPVPPQWILESSFEAGIVTNRPAYISGVTYRQPDTSEMNGSQQLEALQEFANRAEQTMMDSYNTILCQRGQLTKMWEFLQNAYPDMKPKYYPYAYIPEQLQQGVITDVIIIQSVLSFIPPLRITWQRRRYKRAYGHDFHPFQECIDYVMKHMDTNEVTTETLQWEPDGVIKLLKPKDENWITFREYKKIIEDNKDLLRNPLLAKEEQIFGTTKKQRPDDPPTNKRQESPARSRREGSTDRTQRANSTERNKTENSQKKEQEEEPKLKIQAHMSESDNRIPSALITDRQLNQRQRPPRDESHYREIYYEHRGKADKNIPEYIVQRMDPNRKLPTRRYKSWASRDYYLVEDKAKLDRYRKDYERRKQEKLTSRNGGKSVLQLQQILHLDPEKYQQIPSYEKRQEYNTPPPQVQNPKPQEEQEEIKRKRGRPSKPKPTKANHTQTNKNRNSDYSDESISDFTQEPETTYYKNAQGNIAKQTICMGWTKQYRPQESQRKYDEQYEYDQYWGRTQDRPRRSEYSRQWTGYPASVRNFRTQASWNRIS